MHNLESKHYSLLSQAALESGTCINLFYHLNLLLNFPKACFELELLWLKNDSKIKNNVIKS